MRLDRCRCNMRTRLVGDGCQWCNPELAEEYETLICGTCMGSGVGRYGPIDESRCWSCGGTGEVRHEQD